jgi:hypothetical protein
MEKTGHATPPDSYELIAQVYEAFNARRIDEALNALDPDVNWPNGMIGGYMHGRQAVREYWTSQWRDIDPHVDPAGITVEDDGRLAVDVHQVVRDLSGVVLADRMVQHVYTFSAGLVTHMEIRE